MAPADQKVSWVCNERRQLGPSCLLSVLSRVVVTKQPPPLPLLLSCEQPPRLRRAGAGAFASAACQTRTRHAEYRLFSGDSKTFARAGWSLTVLPETP